MGFDIGDGVGVLVKDRLEDLHAGGAVQAALLHHADDGSERLRAQAHRLRLQPLLLEGAQQHIHHPVGDLLRRKAEGHRLLKEVRQRLRAGQQARVVLRQAELPLIARALGLRHLGEGLPQALQLRLIQLDGGDIRLGEVAVVLRVLLRAHGEARVLVLVPAAGLLDDRLVVHLNALLLAAGLVADGAGDRLEGVEVFHLGAGAQLCRAHRADGEVHVAAQRALLHLAVGDAEVLQRGAQLLQISDHLIRRAEVRLGDDLDQRHAAAVVVRAGLVNPVVVHQLAGVLLHVQLVDADHLLLLADADGHPAVAADGEIELRDLVGLGKVRVEVVLPVKLVVAGDLTIEGEAGLHGILQHLPVQDRQGARHTGAHRAAVRVGRAAELRRAGAENLGPGGKLHVGLQTDHHLPIHQCAPPSAACGRRV